NYPWGWAPYRYGSWQYISGYGWCWQPARYYRTWSTFVVVNGPPHYVAPVPPIVVVNHGHTPPPGPVVIGAGGSGPITPGGTRTNWYRSDDALALRDVRRGADASVRLNGPDAHLVKVPEGNGVGPSKDDVWRQKNPTGPDSKLVKTPLEGTTEGDPHSKWVSKDPNGPDAKRVSPADEEASTKGKSPT